jgi:NAD(P)H-dependent flavin oxidoreductase YrpB (nitropropane dioxygenase family)
MAGPDHHRTRRAQRQAPDRPAAPFAVNQIVHKSNDRLEHDLEMCVRYKVPIVITSLGARVEVNEAVHSTAASCCTT